MYELEYEEEFGKDFFKLSKKNPYVFLHLSKKLKLFGKTNMIKFKSDVGIIIKRGIEHPIVEISIKTPPRVEIVEVSFRKFYKKLCLFKILNIDSINEENYSESREEDIE